MLKKQLNKPQMNSNLQTIRELEYTIIPDKALAHQDLLYKLIIIGDTGVGKSCLLARIMDNDFKIEHQVTIGVEFGAFIVEIEKKIVKLQIWDTAGQESFRSITRIFYRGAHCVFLTYDITREETFQNVLEWLKEVKQHATNEVLIYLIGNRSDLEEYREVPREKAVTFCREQGIQRFFETSAKTGDCVEEVFSLAARELYIQQIAGPAISDKDTEDSKSKKKKKGEKITKSSMASDKGKKKGGCCK